MAASTSTPDHVGNARQINGTSKSKLQKKSDLQRRLEDDVLMASRVGDPLWLEQSLDMMKISLNFEDKDVSVYYFSRKLFVHGSEVCMKEKTWKYRGCISPLSPIFYIKYPFQLI